MREERPQGVHVGMVLPGFIATEGFPATELREGRSPAGWSPSRGVAEAIVEAGPGGKAERYVPRPYALAGDRPHPRPAAWCAASSPAAPRRALTTSTGAEATEPLTRRPAHS